MTRRSEEAVKDLIRSIERLASLDVLVLCPGQTEPTDDKVNE